MFSHSVSQVTKATKIVLVINPELLSIWTTMINNDRNNARECFVEEKTNLQRQENVGKVDSFKIFQQFVIWQLTDMISGFLMREIGILASTEHN